MSKPQAKPETSQKSKLVFIGALLITVAAFYFISGLMKKSEAVNSDSPGNAQTQVFEGGAKDSPFLDPPDFILELMDKSEFWDIAETASCDSYYEYELSDKRNDVLHGKLILSLNDETVCAFTLVFPIPAQPQESGAYGIAGDLYKKDTELYELGIQNIMDTFGDCAEILGMEGAVSYASLDSMNYLIGQTIKDCKQREEKTNSYVMTADVREESGGETLHLSLELKGAVLDK
jgi:hypothetical protein